MTSMELNLFILSFFASTRMNLVQALINEIMADLKGCPYVPHLGQDVGVSIANSLLEEVEPQF